MFISGSNFEQKKTAIPRRSRTKIKRPTSQQLPQLFGTKTYTLSKLPNPKQRNSSQYKLNNLSKKGSYYDVIKQYETQHVISQTSSSKLPLKQKVEQKRTKKIQIKKTQIQDDIFDNQDKMLAYYRYSPFSIISICGQKQQFIKSLVQKGDVDIASNGIKKKKGLQVFWQKLGKIANLKGKYRYRQKFNFNYSIQLKILGYKKKQNKKKKESQSSSQQSENDRKQKCRDMQTWKKSMGVQGSKVFVVKGKYKDLRNALLQRGWVQNQDRHSHFYDLKWTTKVNDVNFQSLKSHQLVNHFNNNACLTSKYGIIKSLRSIMYSQNVDIDQFFPKAYDISDLQDFQNFLEYYKVLYAQSIIKASLMKQPDQNDLARIKVAYNVVSRRLLNGQKLLSNIVSHKYAVCSLHEWQILTGKQQGQQPKQQWCILNQKIQQILNIISKKDPQYRIDGHKNIWIVKPAFLSRGRGIKCVSDLQDILDLTVGRETQYVVQKYIQRPLLINKRKFDIRQWVVVQDYAPPRIWFYGQFYVRFCLQQYDQSKLGNRYAHLTNNSIQKYNTKISNQQLQKESMWTMQQLKQWVQTQNGEGSLKQIISRMKQIVIASIVATQDQVYGRKNSFQLIGYDFMIDDDLKPWLIQVNSSPSMDYSTPVTRKLVKMVLEDTVKIVVDFRGKKKKKNAGLFKLIYDGENPYVFKHYKLE